MFLEPVHPDILRNSPLSQMLHFDAFSFLHGAKQNLVVGARDTHFDFRAEYLPRLQALFSDVEFMSRGTC